MVASKLINMIKKLQIISAIVTKFINFDPTKYKVGNYAIKLF